MTWLEDVHPGGGTMGGRKGNGGGDVEGGRARGARTLGAARGVGYWDAEVGRGNAARDASEALEEADIARRVVQRNEWEDGPTRAEGRERAERTDVMRLYRRLGQQTIIRWDEWQWRREERGWKGMSDEGF
jgi:hypothetical protein